MTGKSVSKPNTTIELAILILFSLVAFAFWNTIFIYPIKLFVVFLHELSHGLIAVLTGGEIVKIEIDPNIGGVCYTRGGISFLVASAGYVGSIILGGWMFFLASKKISAKFLSFILIILVLSITIVFVRNSFGLAFGIIFSLALFLVTKFAPEFILQYFLKFIALISCFYVLIDIKEDLFTSEYRGSDADMIASITGISPIFWAILWILVAFLSFIFFLKKSLK